MKKSLLLLAGLLLVSSMASAKVEGDSSSFTIDCADETLTFKLKACVQAPLAAWWEEQGFFESRTLCYNMGKLSIGQDIPSIPTKEIYVIAPFAVDDNSIHAEIDIQDSEIVLYHETGPETITIPLELQEKNGSSAGQSIEIDPDSAGIDANAVTVAEAATGLTDLSNYVGGEIINVVSNPDGDSIAVPLNPGSYTGTATIIVSYQP